MAEAVKSGMRGDAYSRQPDANSNEPIREYDDPYARLTVRPGTVEAQRVAGRAALDSLSRRFGLDSVARRFDRAAIGQDTVLGSRLFANFRAGKPNALIGQTIASAADLAALAQVYRDPRFETLRLFLVDKRGQVIKESGLTSRMPAMVAVPKDYSATVQALMNESGAAGWYLLHNHPSGSAGPSPADVNLTRSIAAAVPGFRAHVVIDHNEYAVIDGAGATKVIQAPELAGTDFRSQPERNHPLLGFWVASPKDVLDLADPRIAYSRRSENETVFLGTALR